MNGKIAFTVATTDVIEKLERAKQNGKFKFEYRVCPMPMVSDTLPSKPLSVTNALQFVRDARGELVEIYAEALAKTGRGADAAALARQAVLKSENHPSDWPFQILADEMATDAFLRFMDDLYAADRYEERPLIWKAEALRRKRMMEQSPPPADQGTRPQ